MNTQLTAEDRARIFAMYLGCEAKCNQNFMPNRNSINADGHLIMSPSILADCYEGTFQYGHFQLHLFDLSDISDEDAIEVAVLAGYLRNHPKGVEALIWKGKSDTNTRISVDKLNYKQADYLRSKSYMLPYKGVNLFDAGIAIRKTKTITQ